MLMGRVRGQQHHEASVPPHILHIQGIQILLALAQPVEDFAADHVDPYSLVMQSDETKERGEAARKRLTYV